MFKPNMAAKPIAESKKPKHKITPLNKSFRKAVLLDL